MGLTLLVALLVVAVALAVGIMLGRRHGPVVGLASAGGVLATGALGYFALLVFTLPM